MDVLVRENDIYPVTALCYCGEFVLAGEGPFVRVYQHSTREPLSTHRVFRSQLVHGIVYQDASIHGGLIIVWGGSLVRVISVLRSLAHASPPQLCLGPLLDAPDWILCIEFAPSPHHDTAVAKAALVTAHNTLCYIFIDEITHAAREPLQNHLHASLEELASTSRSVLYSAHLSWLSHSHVLVASGTVFGAIWVWSCQLGGKDPGNGCTSYRAQLHHVLLGHDGSVFGVHISPELKWSHRHGPCRLLASCSDDRTIRMWDISELPDDQSSTEPGAPDVLEYRQTGFVTRTNAIEDKDSKCLAMAWGHASRIWSVLFLEYRGTIIDDLLPLRLVSRGEDASCQYWVLSDPKLHSQGDLKHRSPLSLKHERTYAHHSGKNLWSIATSSSSSSPGDVSTGGADGSIVTYSDLLRSHSDYMIQERWMMDKLLQALDREPIEMDVPQHDMITPFYASTAAQGDAASELTRTFREPTSVPSQELGRTLWMSGGNATQTVHKDAFKSYAFLKGGDLIVTSHAGIVWLASLRPTTEGKRLTWRKLGQYDHLLSYSISTSIVSQEIAFVAGVTGVILCYDNMSQSLFEICSTEGKVAGLFAQVTSGSEFSSQRTLSNDNMVILLVTHVGINTADIVVLDILSTPSKTNVSIHATVRLLLPADFIVTSMAARSVNRDHMVLFLGARNGHVGSCLIERSWLMADGCEERTHPLVQLFRDRTAGDAITSLTWIGLEATDLSSTIGCLLSTSRDGTYAIRELLNGSITPDNSCTIIHRSTLPFGHIIEGAYLSKAGQLLLNGFRSKQFVLWDETNQTELMYVNCGGSHRNWAFQPTELSDGCTGGRFVWTQASKMHLYSSNAPSHQVVKPGGHGREIKAIAVGPSTDQNGNWLFATGAEDTDIRIFEMQAAANQEEVSQFRCLRTLRKHNTGIQHLQWSEDGRLLFSSGGFEEFFVWRVRRNIPVIDIGVICESTCPPESILPDLRITSFAVREITAPELAHNRAAVFSISMVYSDSTVRVYQYTSTTAAKQWTLLAAGNYLSSCLTQCALPHDGFGSLVTAGTDGHIALWDLSIPPPVLITNETAFQPDCPPNSAAPDVGILKWHTRHKIHQNTVKCLTQARLDSSTFMLVTGGDDNALGITLLRLCATHGSKAATLLIPRAHAAAITGVALFKVSSDDADRDGESSGQVDKYRSNESVPETERESEIESAGGSCTYRLLTASNDQRIKVWQISVDLCRPSVEGVNVRRVANEYSGIADVSDMDLFWDESTGWRVVICGLGMEVWRFGVDGRTGRQTKA